MRPENVIVMSIFHPAPIETQNGFWAYYYTKKLKQIDDDILVTIPTIPPIRLRWLLCRSMFRAIPTGPALFPNVQGDDIDSQKFLAHAARVNSAVDLLIEELDSEDTLTAMLNHLQKQHIDRNLPAAGYAVSSGSFYEFLFFS